FAYREDRPCPYCGCRGAEFGDFRGGACALLCADAKGQRKVFVPNKLLECVPRLTTLPNERLRWNTNEEIASYLISFERHEEWLTGSLKTRPKNGSIVLYNRKKVKYRKDGYCWKKRKDGKTTREDHMKLKVQGMEVCTPH
uniref:Calmodulin binding transcription activator 2 n=1 Tax=Oryzias sinensis TaxID=183150 RepID=A0A8C7XT77_9TELE